VKNIMLAATQNVFNNPLEDLWSLESKKIQGLWHTEIARKKKEIWNETGKDIKEREGTEKFLKLIWINNKHTCNVFFS